MSTSGSPELGGPASLHALERCFGGAIPAVLATASADGVPNVTYLSKAHRVDGERIALSNQFMSKTVRNLAVNPRASLLLIDPTDHAEYRLSIVYERTERRGHVFERLRTDIDAVAALSGMQDVFRLRAATIFRVVDVVQVEPNPSGMLPSDLPDAREPSPDLAAVAELAAGISRCGDLDALVDTALDGLDRLFGYALSHLLLLDEEGRRLYTVASRGFGADSVGAEVVVGEGPVGTAAARCEPVRIGNLLQMRKYSRSILRQFEDNGGVRPGREVKMPELPGTESRLIVPAVALGQLVGVLVVDSVRPVAFGVADEQVLGTVAAMLASAIEHLRALERDDDAAGAPVAARARDAPGTTASPVVVRFFPVDGSTFLDSDYLIKGVAGRILWSLLRQHTSEGRVDFTNRELRLDRSLQLPGFKDNLESRLMLLKRRLDERSAPVRIERTDRGRFRLLVTRPLRLSCDDD